MTDLFHSAKQRLDSAAAHIAVDADVLEKLKYPQETLSANLLVRMDDGSTKEEPVGDLVKNSFLCRKWSGAHIPFRGSGGFRKLRGRALAREKEMAL